MGAGAEGVPGAPWRDPSGSLAQRQGLSGDGQGGLGGVTGVGTQRRVYRDRGALRPCHAAPWWPREGLAGTSPGGSGGTRAGAGEQAFPRKNPDKQVEGEMCEGPGDRRPG